MIGSTLTYAEWLPEPGQAKGVEIDIDGRYIGIRYPMDSHVVGDAKESLRQLIPLLQRKQDRSWREGIEKNIAEWHRILDDRAGQEFGNGLNPQYVTAELSPRLPEGCIITSDAGSPTNWWARHLTLRKGMQASLSGNLATMGGAVPYAIGAKFAYPERPVIALFGDGAFQMNGMLEMITVKRYLDRLSNGPLVFVVYNNQDLNQVTWEQRAMAGDAWDEALSADGPVVLEFKVDQEVPPMPPHIKKELGKKAAKSWVKDPERVGLVEHGAKQKMAEYYEKLPGRD